MRRSHLGGEDRPPTSADDKIPPQADNVANRPDKNFRNSSREAKHQQDLLKNHLNNLVVLVEQGDRI